MTGHRRIPWKRKRRIFCLFFVYSPCFNLTFAIALMKLHWSNLRQINKPANKNLFKVSVIDIDFLDFVGKCFDPLNRYLLSCLHPCFNKVNDRGKLGHWDEKNLVVLPSLWSDDKYTEKLDSFGNSHHEGTDQRNCSFWPAEVVHLLTFSLTSFM